MESHAQKRDVPAIIFQDYGTGKIEKLGPDKIADQEVMRLIRKVVLPEHGEKLGWLRLVEVKDGKGFTAIEWHVTEESARAPCGEKVDESNLLAIVWFRPDMHYEREELRAVVPRSEVQIARTDAEEVGMLAFHLSEKARSLCEELGIKDID